MNRFDTKMTTTIIDMALQSARQIVLEYMYFILHKDYESAYAMLSNYNKKRINKRDFNRWQSLIGEIHQLIEFDCVVESIRQADHQENTISEIEKSLIFKIKVREKNLILNRIEEAFFLRKLVYEDGILKIRLNDINLKKFIKKYGKIIALNHKNRKKLKKMQPYIEDHYPTQQLAMEVFIKHSEYERSVRYKSPFVLIKIEIDQSINLDNLDLQVYGLLEKHMRKMDAFTKFENHCYLLILPETDLSKGQLVSEKISNLLENNIQEVVGKITNVQVITSEASYVSIKEILEAVNVYL